MSINVSSRESRRIDLDQFDFGEIDKLDPSLSSDNQTVGINLKFTERLCTRLKIRSSSCRLNLRLSFLLWALLSHHILTWKGCL
jgi:hypothetical protein